MTAKFTLPPGFRIVKNHVVPAADKDCSRVVFDMARDLDVVLPFVAPDRRTTCIQAGGNFGVFPRELAKHFERVITFEPHPANFAALTLNTAHLPNVTRLQAALGNSHGRVGLELADHEKQNYGAFYVTGIEGDPKGVQAPVLRIDDFETDNLGLVYLDIEGFEFNALQGAYETIKKHRPVIAIEDKGLSEKYGTPKGAIEGWLAHHFDYVVLARVHRDVVLGHAAEFMDIG